MCIRDSTRIQLAVALSESTLQSIAERDGHWQDEASWDPERQRVRAERLLKLGALVVQRTPQPSPAAALCRTLLIEQLKKNGSLDALPWTDSSDQLRQRLAWVHQQVGAPWPDRDLTTLLEQADTWLGPSLEGCLGWSDISATALEEHSGGIWIGASGNSLMTCCRAASRSPPAGKPRCFTPPTK